MAYDVALSTMITAPVSLRLRTLALLENRPLTQLVDDLLGRTLPSAEELGRRLSHSDTSAFTADSAADAPPETETAATATAEAALPQTARRPAKVCNHLDGPEYPNRMQARSEYE